MYSAKKTREHCSKLPKSKQLSPAKPCDKFSLRFSQMKQRMAIVHDGSRRIDREASVSFLNTVQTQMVDSNAHCGWFFCTLFIILFGMGDTKVHVCWTGYEQCPTSRTLRQRVKADQLLDYPWTVTQLPDLFL